MDPNGHIYRAPEDEIPSEDKERMEIYMQFLAGEEREQILQERIEKVDALRRRLGEER